MLKYVLKRALLLIPTLLVVLTLVFILMRLVPGGPERALLNQWYSESKEEEDFTEEQYAEVRAYLGTDKPIPVQLWNYYVGILSGNWGMSYFDEKPVFANMRRVWEPTLIMDIYATIITVVLALPLGIFAATHRGSVGDLMVTSGSTVVMCIPGMCFALLVAYFLGFRLGWFPVVGYTSLSKGDFWKTIWSLTLPSFAVGIRHVASIARYTRSTFLDILNQDYIRTARAKGMSMNRIYYKHVLKNTLSIVGTLIARSITGMLSGAFIIESVFNINGMGKLCVSSISRRDYPQQQAIVLFFAFVTLGMDLLLDIFYKLLDPRIDFS